MKQKLIYMGFGAGIIVAFELMIGLSAVLVYKFGGFNSSSLVTSGTALNDFYSFGSSSNTGTDIVSGNFLGNVDLNKKLVKDKSKDGFFKLYFTETKKDESYIEINKNILDFMYVIKYFQGNTGLTDFIVAYLGMNGYVFDINNFSAYISSVDEYPISFNGLKTSYQKDIMDLASFLNSSDKEQITKWYGSIYSSYSDLIKSYKSRNINTCYYSFCTDYPEVYGYVKNAILNDKKLYSNLTGFEEKYGIDKKYFYGILMIENLRMHTTFKGNFKQFLVGLKTPVLPVMNQFSYGMYGMKMKVITSMVNQYLHPDNVFYIGQNTLLENIRNTYYTMDSKNNYFLANGMENKLIDYVVNDKSVQTELIAIYLQGQIVAWKKLGIDLSTKPGLLFTLYNIGSFKQPHLNPEIGGAPISMTNKIYSFGDLGQRFYYSLELDNIINQLEVNNQ